MSDLKYALVDLSEFLKASSLNDYLYNTIISGNWQVTRMVCVQYLGIGVSGINIDTSDNGFDDQFVMFVNGSSYIQNNCVVNKDLYVYGNINISGNADLNTLSVSDFTAYNNAYIKNLDVSNASIINLNTNNVSINNLSIYTSFISNCDASFNKKMDVSDNATFFNNVSINKNAIILGNTSMNTLEVTNDVVLKKNMSVPLLTVTNNASILNISSHNLNVNTNAVINNLNVTNVNVSNIANISTINATNVSMLNLSVINNTTIHELLVNTSTTLKGGATVIGELSSNNLISSKTVLNGELINNANTSVYGNSIYLNSKIKVGGLDTVLISNTSSLVDIQGQAYIQTLYVGQIFTNSAVQQTNVSAITSLGITQFSVVNKTSNNECYAYIGESLKPLFVDIHTYGAFNLGISSTDVPSSVTTTSTFNLKAKSSPIQPITSLSNISNNGIIYEGPIQIGNTSTCLFNLSARGVMNYDGSMNIGLKNPTLLNISSHGIINIRNLSTEDLSFNTILDIDASSVLQGIKYRGKLDVSGEFFLDGNINLTGNVYSRSDIKIKNNLAKLENTLSKIQNLNGYTYNRNDLPNISTIHIGLIAQEVEKEYPQLISEENNVKTINYTSMIAILVESIKELKKEINELKIKFNELKLK
jgi:hypothetical protein